MVIMWMVMILSGDEILGQEIRGPKLVVPQPVIQVGEVGQWETVERSFTLTNQGTDTLQIERVSPD